MPRIRLLSFTMCFNVISTHSCKNRNKCASEVIVSFLDLHNIFSKCDGNFTTSRIALIYYYKLGKCESIVVLPHSGIPVSWIGEFLLQCPTTKNNFRMSLDYTHIIINITVNNFFVSLHFEVGRSSSLHRCNQQSWDSHWDCMEWNLNSGVST